MIYYVGPLAKVSAIEGSPWVRSSIDESKGITKLSTPLDPTPSGVESRTHEEALELMETAEWLKGPPDTE